MILTGSLLFFFSLFFFFGVGAGVGAGFKKSVESSMTRPIRNQLSANRIDIDTRHETMSGLAKTRWTRPSSQNDSIDWVKIQRIESP